MISDLLTLFDQFFTGLLFLFSNTVISYLIGLCIVISVFALIKRLIT